MPGECGFLTRATPTHVQRQWPARFILEIRLNLLGSRCQCRIEHRIFSGCVLGVAHPDRYIRCDEATVVLMVRRLLPAARDSKHDVGPRQCLCHVLPIGELNKLGCPAVGSPKNTAWVSSSSFEANTTPADCVIRLVKTKSRPGWSISGVAMILWTSSCER